MAAIAKNRQVTAQTSGDESARKQGLEAIAQTLAAAEFTPVQLNLEQPRTVWVALLQVHVPNLEGTRWLAIQLNAATWQQATEVDYFLTNASDKQISATPDGSNLFSTQLGRGVLPLKQRVGWV